MTRPPLPGLLLGLALVVGAPTARGQATLYGVTGDGADSPEELFSLDTGDATETSFLVLGAGDAGETIALDPDDGRLYHASGDATPVFEAIDLGTKAVTPIPLSGYDYGEGLGMTWDPAAGAFLLADDAPSLVRLTPAGLATLVGGLDHVSKGLALAGGTLYSVARGSPTLREIDAADGSTLASRAVTLPGFSVSGATGLAADPSSGTLWVVLKVDPGSTRVLATLDPATGTAQLVGVLADKFAGIAFGLPQPVAVPALSAPGLLALAAALFGAGAVAQRGATRWRSDSPRAAPRAG